MRAAATPILTPRERLDQALSVASMRNDGIVSSDAKLAPRGCASRKSLRVSETAGRVSAAAGRGSATGATGVDLGATESGAACRLIGLGAGTTDGRFRSSVLACTGLACAGAACT